MRRASPAPASARRPPARRGGAALPALAALAGALAGCAAGQPEPAPVSYQTETWEFARTPGHKLVTEHYEIYTTLNHPVLLDALPGFVEAAFARCQALLPPGGAPAPAGRMRIYLFASRGQWEAFTRRFTGPRAATFLKVRNGGYSERGVTVIEYVASDVTFPLLAHEGFHQYVHHYLAVPLPAWLNEGLAVWCEGQRWGLRGLKAFEPGFNPRRHNDLAQALQTGRLHPLRDLLETHAGEVIDGSSRAVLTYYAQLWALMLFLQEGAEGRYAAGFARLLAAARTGDLEAHARAAHIWSEGAGYNYGEALFRSFISEELDAVEREYRAFMRARFLGPS